MSAFLPDLRVTLRALARRPGFALTASLTIAVAIAGNTAIFSVVRGVLFSNLPFPDPQQLITLDARASTGFLISTSMPNYRDWSERNRVLSSVGGAADWGLTVTGQGPAETLETQAVVGDFFGTLGMTSYLGRLIGPQQPVSGVDAVVVLGYGYWQRALAGERSIIGRKLMLEARPYTVIGVLADQVGFPHPGVDAYVPLGTLPGLPWEDRRSSFGLRMIGRLAPGVTMLEGRSDFERVGREVRALSGTDTAVPEMRALQDYFVRDIRLQVSLLMGAVGFVLLIAAGNVANLLLARGEARRQEMSVRTALGAGRSVLIRQILGESLVLSLGGGLVGVAIAHWCIKALLFVFAGTLPALAVARIRLDTGVLMFALLLSVGTGVLFGLMPALRASRIDLAQQMKAGARSVVGGRDRMRSALVVSELALALVLLVGAVLMMRSLQHLEAVDKGFSADNVLTARVRLPREVSIDTARWKSFYQEALAGVRGLPGVREAAVSLLVPLTDRSWERGIWPEGVPPVHGTGQSVLYNVVSPEYFTVLGVTIVKGRGFTAADRQGSVPVAIIDETMAQRFWPGEDPVSKRVTFERTSGDHDGEPIYRTVIGVVKNVRHYELSNPSRIQVYVPFDQVLMGSGPALSILVKTVSSPSALFQSIRQVIASLNPDVPVSNLQTMQGHVRADLAGSRALLNVLGAFGATALLLATIGVFGVISYTVAQRTNEIGVRMALGASRGQVLRWVTTRALLLCGVGMLVGTAAAAGLSRLLTRLLYQVSPLDPTVYLGAAALLLVTSLGAAWLPARRAAGVNPVEALRRDQ